MRAGLGMLRSGRALAGTSVFRNGSVGSCEHGFSANHELEAVIRTSTLPVARSIRFSPSPEILLTFPGLQRVRRPARQAPGHARGSVIKLNLTADAQLRHRVDDRAAEATALWWRHARPVALSPAHRERIALKPPSHVDPAGVH